MSTGSNVVQLTPRNTIPAAFAGRALPDMNQAAQAGISAGFAVIGYKGRNWRIRYRGDDELLKDERGVPLATLDVVIVGISQAISKQFYDKKYAEGDQEAPDCFSVNGVSPDASSPKRQCDTCAVCPQNIWGSRVNDNGKKIKACQDTRRLAVVPYGDLQNETYGGPMLLRLPPTSLVNLASYGRELSKFGAQPYAVRTLLGFNYDVAYPLITFSPAGWLGDEDAVQVVDVLENPLIERMLETEVTEATHDPVSASPLAQGGPSQALAQASTQAPTQGAAQAKPPVAAQAAAPTPAAAPAARAAAPAATPATTTVVEQPPAAPAIEAEDDEEAKLAQQLAEAKARKAAKAKAAAAAQPQVNPQIETKAAAVVEAKAEVPQTPLPAPNDMEAAIDALLAG